MTISRLALSGLALFGLCTALSSCAVSLCDKDPSDPRCDQNVVPVDTLQVMPTRIATAGTHVTVRLGKSTGTVILRQGSKQIDVGALSDGVLEVQITPAMLAQGMISIGEAKLVVSRPSKADETASVRVYVEPMFASPISYDTKPDGETPEGVVIKPSGNLWGFQSFPRGAGRAQHFIEYQMSPGMLVSRGPSFSNYSLAAWPDRPARAVIQAKRLVAFSRDLFAGPDAIQLDICGLNPELCSPLSVTPDFGKVLGLATDSKGTMLAVQSDQDVYVYQSSDPSPIDRRQQIQGVSAVSGQMVALGELNGDGRIDLVTVAGSGSSVFLGQQGGTLALDATWSTKLSGVLSGSIPTAVTMADIDLDGLDDVIVASGTSLQIVYPLPNGSFTVSTPLSGLDSVDSISVGPVDGQPSSGPDIAISSKTAQRIAVIVNQSTF
jgi:hypothetical protein